MTRMKSTLLALSGAALLSVQGCATMATDEPSLQAMQDSGVEALTTAELYELHDGDPVTMSWTSPRGEGTAEFNLDGTLTVDWGTGSDQGEYYIATGQLCSMLEETLPEMRCVTYYPTESPNEYLAFDDEGNWVGTYVY